MTPPPPRSLRYGAERRPECSSHRHVQPPSDRNLTEQSLVCCWGFSSAMALGTRFEALMTWTLIDNTPPRKPHGGCPRTGLGHHALSGKGASPLCDIYHRHRENLQSHRLHARSWVCEMCPLEDRVVGAYTGSVKWACISTGDESGSSRRAMLRRHE